jgi:GntR family transcriptional regulator
MLAESGIVRSVPGRTGGTFVAHAKVDRDLSVIVGLPEYLRRQGFVAEPRWPQPLAPAETPWPLA